MIEVATNVWVGNLGDCRTADDSFKIIHACKTPCHQMRVGYRGSLSPTHPNYLILQDGRHLFLNMVDMAQPWQPRFADPMFQALASFCCQGDKLLFHCNQGESRGPSAAMLWLSLTGAIDSSSYESACEAFTTLYPQFKPASGISAYLKERWSWLMALKLEASP